MALPRKHLDVLMRARVGLTNARDVPEMQAALAPFGYDAARLDAGLALAAAAEAASEQQDRAYARRRNATSAARKAGAAFRATYIRHVKLARVAFKPGSDGYLLLGLRGDRPDATPALLAQARAFYQTLLDTPDLLAQTALLSLGEAAANAALALADALDAARTAQQKERGEAQRATRTRNAAISELRGFWADFVTVAKIALEDQPQAREILGLLERS